MSAQIERRLMLPSFHLRMMMVSESGCVVDSVI